MNQRVTGLYALTQSPSLYELGQHALGAFKGRRTLVDSYIRPSPGQRILDLGCGPAAILPYLGDVAYVGIDLNGAHIAKAQACHGNRGRFHVGDFASLRSELGGSFDIVSCIGLVHHLDDARVRELALLARDYLILGGRLVTIDPVFSDGQTWIARRMAAADSGQCVRTSEGYRALISSAFDKVQVHVRHDLLRIPYSHCILEAERS
jgi:SAM-dependent methyltransferase